ncbi:MAG: hypothetical protein J6C28_07025 [Bacilli bacterium]|nr:hypothetical protein [Bacilli bacterium]
MGFFNEDFYKELDKNIEDEEDVVDEFDFDDEDEVKLDSTYYAENMNLEVNKSNKEKFKSIMDNASSKYDSYWDSNNPVIRFVLIVLLVIIAVGLLYYIVGWFTIL